MLIKIICGNSKNIISDMPSESVDCVVTSPPYWGLRDYGHRDQMGQEATPEEYISSLVTLFRDIRRVLKHDGTCWVNLGDSYSGSGKGPTNSIKQLSNTGTFLPPKNLLGIPWRFALAAQADGWILRQDIIWHKTNQMPESVKDRCTKAHEYVFLLVKSERYWWDAQAMQEDGIIPAGVIRKASKKWVSGPMTTPHRGRLVDSINNGKRNRRSVWAIGHGRYFGAHFATFPLDLIRPMIRAGCRPEGVVLDPFLGSGTTAAVALQEGRSAIGIDINPEYVEIAKTRCAMFLSENVSGV